MKKFKIGAQLYSVREDMEKDFEGTIKKIKDMGYETEETSDGKVFGIRNPKTKRWLDPSQYSREEKKKVDFKNQLDTEKKSNQGRMM